MLQKKLIVLLLALVVVAHSQNDEVILPRVVGGTATVIGEAPSVVSILVPTQTGPDDNPTYCSGTIINVNHIVTSCLCVQNATFHLVNPFWVRIIAGDLNILTPSYGRFVTNATHIYTHPDYTHTPRANDIAVIRTSQPFPFPHNSIDFAVRNTIPLTTGHNCRFVGWGATQDGADALINPIQNFLATPILDRTTCPTPNLILDNMICAGSLLASSGVCTGNLGGGLFCNVNGWFEFTGVLSTGLGCGAANQPGVYMQVRDFNVWIDQQLTRTDATFPGTLLITPPAE